MIGTSGCWKDNIRCKHFKYVRRGGRKLAYCNELNNVTNQQQIKTCFDPNNDIINEESKKEDEISELEIKKLIKELKPFINRLQEIQKNLSDEELEDLFGE